MAHAARAIDVLFGGGGTGSYTSLAEAQQTLRALERGAGARCVLTLPRCVLTLPRCVLTLLRRVVTLPRRVAAQLATMDGAAERRFCGLNLLCTHARAATTGSAAWPVRPRGVPRVWKATATATAREQTQGSSKIGS